MTKFEKRLMMIESALTPKVEKSLIIRITRAGREIETPLHFVHHTTGNIYHHDSDTSHLKGVNVMMAVYSNGD